MIGFPHKEAAIVCQDRAASNRQEVVALSGAQGHYGLPKKIREAQRRSHVAYAEARYHLFKHLDQKREG